MMAVDAPPSIDPESTERYKHYFDSSIEESQLPGLATALLEFDDWSAHVHPTYDMIRKVCLVR